MKRTGFLFEKIVDINNIVLAHLNARQNKTNDKQVQMVDHDIFRSPCSQKSSASV